MKAIVLFFCFFVFMVARDNPFEPMIIEKSEQKSDVKTVEKPVVKVLQKKVVTTKKTPIQKNSKQIGKFVRLSKNSFVLVYQKTLDLRVDGNLVKFILLPEQNKISFEFESNTKEGKKTIEIQNTPNYKNAQVSNNENGSLIIDIQLVHSTEQYIIKHEKNSILIVVNQ